EACEEVGARLCLFVEPIVAQVQASRELGAAQVEFHTGHYCDAPTGERPRLLEDFVRAIEVAHSLGLEVAAGHGLTTGNVGPIARLPHMAELNIGHSVISEAVYVGLPAAVRSLRAAIDAAIDVA